ncbi:hypothetical protein PHMEG_0004635 [Phytophthora megakarya]|uniref:Tyr recombinase domain-containing protein n=1 Tax=Phytophthora megakarya TaxID=4795 RepID=A0A225WV14_9STRA|nr:hypothetical protein PHMEG_0004635 [Phytophthora megakarya]
MADAGPRARSTDHPLFTVWTTLSDSWSQVPILPPFDNLLGLWEMFPAKMLLHGQLPGSIQRTDANGCFAIYCWKHGWNQHRHGNTFNIIKPKLASIRWYHKWHLGIDLLTSPDFTILLQGIKRLPPPVHKLQAMTPAFLRLLYHRLDLQQPHHRLLWGSVLVGFFFLLRRSEYLRIGQSRHFYYLKHQNSFFPDGRKTNNRGQCNFSYERIRKSEKLSIWTGGGVANNARIWRPDLIALKHLNIVRRSANHTSRYLYGNLTATAIAKAFKVVAKSMGVPESNYSTHSVRIGGSTALLSGQANVTAIKLLVDGYPTASNSTPSKLPIQR